MGRFVVIDALPRETTIEGPRRAARVFEYPSDASPEGALPGVGGKVRAVSRLGSPSLPGIIYVGIQVVLLGLVPFRICKARADAPIQALPEITGGFVNNYDLLSFEGYFLPRGLQNFNL